MLYTQDYVNGIEYKNSALEAIYHSEGRVTTIDGTLKYEYAMKDHLGNTRLMFCDRNGDGVIKPENAPEQSEVTQENSYYAFGMNMEFGAWENTPSVTDNLYLYNNRELNTDFGLNWEHNDWRFYDPTVGRFWSIDKEAEKPNQVDYTPYHFGFNNPIKNSDPTGLEGEACCGGISDLANNTMAAIAGTVSAIADNVIGGTAFRDNGSSGLSGDAKINFDRGATFGDGVSVVGGTLTTALGIGVTGGSGVVTAVSGGTLTPITAVTAAGGIGVTAIGVNVASNGVNNLLKAADNSKQEGSYTNTHESGKQYHGKGGEDRAKESADRIAKKHDDPVKSTDWTPSKNKREAFKDESRRLEKDKVGNTPGHKNPNNYNRRDSPGTKFRKKDGD